MQKKIHPGYEVIIFIIIYFLDENQQNTLWQVKPSSLGLTCVLTDFLTRTSSLSEIHQSTDNAFGIFTCQRTINIKTREIICNL